MRDLILSSLPAGLQVVFQTPRFFRWTEGAALGLATLVGRREIPRRVSYRFLSHISSWVFTIPLQVPLFGSLRLRDFALKPFTIKSPCAASESPDNKTAPARSPPPQSPMRNSKNGPHAPPHPASPRCSSVVEPSLSLASPRQCQSGRTALALKPHFAIIAEAVTPCALLQIILPLTA